MTTVAPATAEKATEMLQKMNLETKSKILDAPEVTKKNTVITSNNRSVTPVLQKLDPNAFYYPQGFATGPFLYGGYDSVSSWDGGYVHDGAEMSHTGIYGDMYHHDYGYNTYSAYPPPGSPAPMLGTDVQQYSSQPYQYPQYYQLPSTPSAYTQNHAPASNKAGVVSTSSAQDKTPVSLDASKSNVNGVSSVAANGSNGSIPQKPSPQISSVTANGSYRGGALGNGTYQSSRSVLDWSPANWYNTHMATNSSSHVSSGTQVPNSALARNRNLNPLPHLMGLHNSRPTSGMVATPGMMNRMFPNNKIYNAYQTGLGYRSNFFDSRTNGRWSVVDNKYKPRGRDNGFYAYPSENLDGLSELNKGPRANRVKNLKGFVSPVTVPVKGESLPATNGNVEDSKPKSNAVAVAIPDKEQYNKLDFNVEYSDAKFFIIKSYSEDDIHKSVKYNVWASTPNGNKKLNGAYQDAQEKGCHVFLFFSVNTSGQFVGMAEMTSPVDFEKTVDYWQQDKWTGCFSVKWHVVKDVPNSILKHIILENNENKPVTNSRDTQEVKLEQGLQVLKIFKDHVSKTSILDDFNFYETRQKVMQEKRAMQPLLQKKIIADVKPVDPINQKTLEAVTISILKKETNIVGLGEKKASEENGTEKKVVANGC